MKTLKTNLLWLMALVIFTAASTIGLAYTVNGHVECEETGWVPYGALVKVFDVDPLPGGGYRADEITFPVEAIVNENGDFTITITTAPPYGGGVDTSDPDLIFQFIQNINGVFETIYEENTSETRWNVADTSSLNFQFNSELAAWSNPGVSVVPNGKLFLFTRVGNCETADIDCKGWDINSEGYHRPRKAPYSFTGMETDRPFGRTLELFGWFGQDCNIAYYKVRYSTDGGITWTDIDTDLPNKWYTSDPYPINRHWVSESMGPFSKGGEDNLYQIPYKEIPGVPPNATWSYLDRVARINSTKIADGPCKFTIVGYKWSGAILEEADSTDIEIDTNHGKIVLQIDNTPPTVQIFDLQFDGDTVLPCEIIDFNDPSKDITVNFRVYDSRGHLREYTVEAMYGHDCTVYPRPSGAADDYNNNSSGSPSWQGSMSYSTQYAGDVYPPPASLPPTLDCSSLSSSQMPPFVMPSCAYQFRLRASKRTTNGYGRIYDRVEDTWHVTIKR